MKHTQWQNIVLSLAGIFQAALLVKTIARTGQIDEQALIQSINSILVTQSESVLDIYSSIENLQIGLRAITQLLKKQTKKNDVEVIRYFASLLYLEKKFSTAPELKKRLLRRIQQAQSQANHLALDDPHVIETLASAFLQTLGQFRYRIQIIGIANYLKQTDIIAKIRTLLLAGIRSTVLWRQLGGNKWQLFFFRRKIVNTAQSLLGSIKQ